MTKVTESRHRLIGSSVDVYESRKSNQQFASRLRQSDSKRLMIFKV